MIAGAADRHVYGLDLIRFIAAVLVSGFHLTWQNPYAPPSLTGSLSWGWIGVEVFFVISGIVITRSAQFAQPIDFVINRFLRLYPAAWICAVLSAGVLLWAGSAPYATLQIAARPGIGQFLGSLVLFGPWRLASAYWTLPIELSFYLVVAIVLLSGRRAHLPVVAAGLVLVSAPYYLALAAHSFHLVDLPWTDLRHGPMRNLLVRHGPCFALGMYLTLFATGTGPGIRASQWLLFGSAMVSALIGIVVRALSLTPSYHAAAGQAVVAGDRLAVAAVAVFLIAFTVLAISVGINHRINPPRLVGAILRRLGLISYPYYLLHEIVGGALLYGLLMAKVPFGLSLLLTVLGVTLVAFAVTGGETGLRHFLQRWLRPGLPAAIPGAGSTATKPAEAAIP